MFRKASISLERKNKLLADKKEYGELLSFFPVDRHDCECAKMRQDWSHKLSMMTEKNRRQEIDRIGTLECPKNKKGMKKYQVRCRNCESILAYLYAKDKSLSDFCDLHYYAVYTLDSWMGCFTVNLNPYDGKLTFECSCGQDTREMMYKKIDNSVGREFGKKNSKFLVEEA
jgi:hypothetical protein